ncbi:MAG: hypothetical protein KGI50_03035 [Patescibacteria group bacterium]|nr:hypothetical protein [Patescibacteria group bacterium]MDE2438267.1 hypothetical protein [Patescibacteria group bacterium]
MHVIKHYLLYFFVGGAFVSLIVGLEEHGSRLLSGFATLIPVFTLIAYIFIGESQGGGAVGQHAWFVLIGTLVSWVPYMLIVALFAPKWGSRIAIGTGLLSFFVCAALYMIVVHIFNLFGGI